MPIHRRYDYQLNPTLKGFSMMALALVLVVSGASAFAAFKESESLSVWREENYQGCYLTNISMYANLFCKSGNHLFQNDISNKRLYLVELRHHKCLTPIAIPPRH